MVEPRIAQAMAVEQKMKTIAAMRFPMGALLSSVGGKLPPRRERQHAGLVLHCQVLFNTK
jgi:hypothetical protein